MTSIPPQSVNIIYNPLAGPVDFSSVIEQIAEQWRKANWQVVVSPTEAAGHASVLAASAAAGGSQIVLAAGGDGTLGEVVNGLAETDTIMGILPAGTSNSFARELEMPLPGVLLKDRLLAASEALLNGRVQTMDLGYSVHPQRNVAYQERPSEPGKFWMLWAGAGADGFLIHELEPRPKWAKRIGWASYVLQGLPRLATFSHVQATVRVDDHSLEGDFVLILISNSRRYAGGFITLSDQAFLDDGLLEVWLFGGRGLSSMSRHAIRAMRGQHLDDPSTILLRGKRVRVSTEPATPIQMDGDPAGVTPLDCWIKPGALRLLVPATAPDGLFQSSGLPLSVWQNAQRTP